MLSGLPQRLWMGRKGPREQARKVVFLGSICLKPVECSCARQLGLYSPVLAGVGHSVTSTGRLPHANVCARPVGCIQEAEKKIHLS